MRSVPISHSITGPLARSIGPGFTGAERGKALTNAGGLSGPPFGVHYKLRNYAPKTIMAYVHQVRGLAHHFKLSPDRLDDDQIRRYLLHLLHDKHAAETSYNQAVAALRFFYEVSSPSGTVVRRLPYGKQSKRLPDVRSTQQVAIFLNT